MGVEQTTRTEAHHLESSRDKDSDYGAISLCVEHHRGATGIHGLSRRGFTMRYSISELHLLKLTVKALEDEGYLV